MESPVLQRLINAATADAFHRRGVGQTGENIAREALEKKGYIVLGQNVRIRKGEIDLLAFDPFDQVLVFAEVKSRSVVHADFRPELNVNGRKRVALKRAARRWVALHDYNGGYRMDLVCVAEGRVIAHYIELAWD